MPENHGCPNLFLPNHWSRHVKSALLHVISIVRLACVHTWAWAAGSLDTRTRLAAQLLQAQAEIALLHEELRIKDARMAQIPAHRRPHYPPTERMAILELRAARGWNQVQTAKAMLVTPETVAAWNRRIDEQGPHALVQLPEPVNRFPDFVRLIVRCLKALCPSMGKVGIARILARASLHLAATTVGRVLNEEGSPPEGLSPETAEADVESQDEADVAKKRVVTAKYPNHVRHVDLAAVPIVGFWVPWLPFALPQVWPFCWWTAVTIDHFSRRAMGVAIFTRPLSSRQVTAFLRRLIRKACATPKYLICDRGPQFWCDGCKDHGIRPRFGAVGQHGSIAVVERFIRSLKEEGPRRTLISLWQRTFRCEVALYTDWHNEHRPHTALAGRTPNEVYFARRPANRSPRFKPRARCQRGSACAKPQILVRGKPGVRLELAVTFQNGR